MTAGAAPTQDDGGGDPRGGTTDGGDPSAPAAIVVRAATESDLPAVVALWERATQPSRTDDVGHLRRLLDHDPESLLVADEGGTVVGSVIAAWDGWRGTIHRLAIAPSHRRRGLGARLVSAAEAQLHTRGAARMQAIVVETDPVATGFWRTTDWEEQVERVRFTKG